MPVRVLKLKSMNLKFRMLHEVGSGPDSWLCARLIMSKGDAYIRT